MGIVRVGVNLGGNHPSGSFPSGSFSSTAVKYVAVQFFTKRTCVLNEICCVLLAFITPDLVWCWWHIVKQIFHVFFV